MKSVKAETWVYLNIITENLIGEKITVNLNNKSADFEYLNKRLNNDILKDYTIGSAKEKVLLKVLRPKDTYK